MRTRQFLFGAEVILWGIAVGLLIAWFYSSDGSEVEPLVILILALAIPGLGFLRRKGLKADLKLTGVHVTYDQSGEPAFSVERYSFNKILGPLRGTMTDYIYDMDGKEVGQYLCSAKLVISNAGDWVMYIGDANLLRRYEKKLYIPQSHGEKNDGYIFGPSHTGRKLQGENYVLIEHKNKDTEIDRVEMRKKLDERLGQSTARTKLEQKYIKVSEKAP